VSSAEIQTMIRERVGNWKPRFYSWPHDSFMDQTWGYAVHEGSVRAWNAEGRQTECVKFLLDWATIENIEAAIAKWGLTDYRHMEEESWTG
jgi:hypothetical protein